jgi:hypothetical protein
MRGVRNWLKNAGLHVNRILYTALSRPMLSATRRKRAFFTDALSKCLKFLVGCGRFQLGKGGDQPFGWVLDVEYLNKIAPFSAKASIIQGSEEVHQAVTSVGDTKIYDR